MNEVQRDTVVPGEPQEAWRAILESDWLGDDVRIDARPGGQVLGGEREGFVEAAEPPSRLVFWWGAEGEETTRVEIDLDECDEGTRVRVVESRPLAVLNAYGSDLGAAIGVRGPQALAV
jgi:uncharacterized protein YndB with AHSA1/START domain